MNPQEPENQDINQDTGEEQRTTGKKPRKILFFSFLGLFGLFVLFAIVGIFINRDSNVTYNPPVIRDDDGESLPNTEITPFPFQEMTIPYLRSREFKSELGELTQVAENARYTTYLTNYNSDGLKINGLLTVPAEAKTALIAPGQGFPAIVFVHGYIPPATYVTTEKYEDYVDYLARNGFVVFKIDLRGHGNSEGDPGGGYYSGDYVIDVLNARAALKSYKLVNPDSIGLWGHSMAGNVVARAMAAAPDIPAVSIWGGAVYTYADFSEYSIDDNSYQPPSEDSPVRRKRNELFETYGTFDPESEFWRQVPMTNYLDEVRGAIQLNHAVNDDVVDIRYSRNLASILEEAGIKHELNEYESGGHNISGSAFVSAMENTVRFFQENL